MLYQFELQKLAIALVARNLNPTATNAKVLPYSGIIPTKWELAQPLIYEGLLQQTEGKSSSGATFTGNFNAGLMGVEPQERIARLQGLTANWQRQVFLFQKLIEPRLRGQVRPLARAG